MGLDPIGGGNGLDTENLTPGEAVIYAGDGEFISEPIDIDRDTIRLSSGDSQTIDTSEIFTTERFSIVSATGYDAGGRSGGSGGDGGDGFHIECDIDLTDIGEIRVVVANGQSGYNDGGDGEYVEWNPDGADGGGSSAIVADGSTYAR